jgi:Na+/proline symporter
MDLFYIALAIFITLVAGITVITEKRYRTGNVGFTQADRNLSLWELSASVTASWTFILGMIMVGVLTYTKGTVGMFWWIAPPTIVMCVMAALSYYLLKKFPQGFSIGEFVQHRYNSKGLTTVFQVVMMIGVINAIAGNLTGFGIVAEYISGTNDSYNTIVTVMALVTIAYSMWGGLKVSVRTDVLQTLLMLIPAVGMAVWGAISLGGVGAIFDAVNTRANVDFFDAPTITNVALNVLFITMGSAITCNGFYQRVFASQDPVKIRNSFLFGGAMFAVILAGLGTLAAMAVPLGLDVTNPKLASTMAAGALWGSVGLVLIALAFLCAASGVIDTALNGAGALAVEWFPKHDPVMVNRLTQLVVGLSCLAIAMLKIDIWILFLTFGIARLFTIAPVVYGVFSDQQIRVKYLIYGMLAAVAVGLLAHFKLIMLPPYILNIVVTVLPFVGIAIDHYRAPKLA